MQPIIHFPTYGIIFKHYLAFCLLCLAQRTFVILKLLSFVILKIRNWDRAGAGARLSAYLGGIWFLTDGFILVIKTFHILLRFFYGEIVAILPIGLLQWLRVCNLFVLLLLWFTYKSRFRFGRFLSLFVISFFWAFLGRADLVRWGLGLVFGDVCSKNVFCVFIGNFSFKGSLPNWEALLLQINE